MHRGSILALLIAVGALCALGIVMLASTGEFAQDAHGRPYFFLQHQLVWLVVGIGLCWSVSRVDYHFWIKHWFWIYALAVVLLILCFIPPIGAKINGSSRWLRLPLVTFQPSELGKLAAILAMSWWFSRAERVEKNLLKGFLTPLAVVGVLMVLIVLEVDVGSTALIGTTTLAVMIVAGSSWKFVVPILGTGCLIIWSALRFMPERAARFQAFLHPELNPADAYQAQQGLIALGSGGISGLGLGNGRQKLLYLPFAHTDFIFPVIGEELGLLGTLGVVLLYVCFILSGVTIAVKARDRQGVLLGMGMTIIIAAQAAVNLGVTTELLPNKGLPLPFISYGGSNLLFCLGCVGVLVNIYRQGLTPLEEERLEQMEMALKVEEKPVRL